MYALSLRNWLSARVRRPRRPWRIVLAVAGGAVALEVARVTVGNNRHEVIPGRVYRCNQPSADQLAGVIATKGIRTVVNLRGFCPNPQAAWYAAEVRTTNAAGISQEDVTFSASRLPPPAELKRLIAVYDRSEPPFLIHCKQGADRTGLAATVALLLYSDATLDQARHQLWPRYGHVRFGRTAAMDEFFVRYESWLAGRPHSPELFRDWAANHYSPGPAAGELTHAGLPPTTAGKWLSIPVTARNVSTEAWELKPGNHAGVHVGFTVQTEAGELVHRGQAGLLRATVPPGESIRLALDVPPLPAGVYTVRADLMDAAGASVPVRQNGFYQFGCDPLLLRLDLR